VVTMSSDQEKKFARSASLLRGETTKAALHNTDEMDEGEEGYDNNGKPTEPLFYTSIDLNDFSIDIEGDDSTAIDNNNNLRKISKDSSYEDVMNNYDQIDNFLQKMKTIRLNGQNNEDDETQTFNLSSTVDGPPIEIQVNDLASLAVSNLDELESTINGDLKTLANTEEARTRLADQVLRLTEQLLEARNEIENKTSELDIMKKTSNNSADSTTRSGEEGNDSIMKAKRGSILSRMLPNRSSVVRKVDSESVCTSSDSASASINRSNFLQTLFASNSGSVSGSASVSQADINIESEPSPSSDAVAPLALPPSGKSSSIVGRSKSLITQKTKNNNDGGFSERIRRSSLLNSISDVFRFEEEILPEPDFIRRRSDGYLKTTTTTEKQKRKSWNRQSDSGVAAVARRTNTRDRPWRL